MAPATLHTELWIKSGISVAVYSRTTRAPGTRGRLATQNSYTWW